MMAKRTRLINTLLIVLTLWDLLLVVVALALPDIWFQIFHGIPYIDENGIPADRVGLLRRTGAVWLAFTLFQLLAYLRWQKQLYWLPLVAGIRLTETFSDWTYIIFSHGDLTWTGFFGLLVAPPINWLLGWFFLRTYQMMQFQKTGGP